MAINTEGKFNELYSALRDGFSRMETQSEQAGNRGGRAYTDGFAEGVHNGSKDVEREYTRMIDRIRDNKHGLNILDSKSFLGTIKELKKIDKYSNEISSRFKDSKAMFAGIGEVFGIENILDQFERTPDTLENISFGIENIKKASREATKTTREQIEANKELIESEQKLDDVQKRRRRSNQKAANRIRKVPHDLDEEIPVNPNSGRINEIYEISKQGTKRDLKGSHPKTLDGLQSRIAELEEALELTRQLQNELANLDVQENDPDFKKAFVAAGNLATSAKNKEADLRFYKSNVKAMQFIQDAKDKLGISSKSKRFDTSVMEEYNQIISDIHNGLLTYDQAMERMHDSIHAEEIARQKAAEAAEEERKHIELLTDAKEKLGKLNVDPDTINDEEKLNDIYKERIAIIKELGNGKLTKGFQLLGDQFGEDYMHDEANLNSDLLRRISYLNANSPDATEADILNNMGSQNKKPVFKKILSDEDIEMFANGDAFKKIVKNFNITEDAIEEVRHDYALLVKDLLEGADEITTQSHLNKLTQDIISYGGRTIDGGYSKEDLQNIRELKYYIRKHKIAYNKSETSNISDWTDVRKRRSNILISESAASNYKGKTVSADVLLNDILKDDRLRSILEYADKDGHPENQPLKFLLDFLDKEFDVGGEKIVPFDENSFESLQEHFVSEALASAQALDSERKALKEVEEQAEKTAKGKKKVAKANKEVQDSVPNSVDALKEEEKAMRDVEGAADEDDDVKKDELTKKNIELRIAKLEKFNAQLKTTGTKLDDEEQKILDTITASVGTIDEIENSKLWDANEMAIWDKEFATLREKTGTDKVNLDAENQALKIAQEIGKLEAQANALDKNNPERTAIEEQINALGIKLDAKRKLIDIDGKEIQAARDLGAEEYRLAQNRKDAHQANIKAANDQKKATSDLEKLYQKLGSQIEEKNNLAGSGKNYAGVQADINNTTKEIIAIQQKGISLDKASIDAKIAEGKEITRIAKLKADDRAADSDIAKKERKEISDRKKQTNDLIALYKKLGKVESDIKSMNDSDYRKSAFEDERRRILAQIDDLQGMNPRSPEANKAYVDSYADENIAISKRWGASLNAQDASARKKAAKEEADAVNKTLDIYKEIGELEAERDSLDVNSKERDAIQDKINLLAEDAKLTRGQISIEQALIDEYRERGRVEKQLLIDQKNGAKFDTDAKSQRKQAINELITKSKELGKLNADINFEVDERKRKELVAQRDALQQVIDKKKQELKLDKDELELVSKSRKEAYKNEENTNRVRGFYGQKELDSANASRIRLAGIIQMPEFKDADVISNSFSKLNDAYDEMLRKQATFEEKYKKRQTLTEQEIIDYSKLVETYNNAEKELIELINTSNKLNKDKKWSTATAIPDESIRDIGLLRSEMEKAIKASVEGKVKIGSFRDGLGELDYSVKNNNGTWSHFTAVLDKATGKIVGINGKIKQTDGLFKSFFSGSMQKFRNAAQIFSGYDLFYEGLEQVRKGIQYVKDIDLALTELKKVTDETEESYAKFLRTAAKTSSVIGSTVADLTNATADFARLGYSVDESLQLAEAASIYKNVGDGIDNIEQASESIISTMKAFGIEANKSMQIVDKFNEVGNNFAISSTGIGEALTKSASALYEAGNTLDESIALITAANSVVQNPEQVGTALKTLSLRLRGAKTELEEAGEDTDGMATSVSSLQTKLKALTGVDIMIDASTFKSTKDIIVEMGKAWEKHGMSDIDMAAALELMGGKRQANILASMIKNYKEIDKIVESSLSSQNSAYEENLKWLDSIEGKTTQFTNALQAMWMNAISSDTVKWFVDLGTTIINIFDNMNQNNPAGIFGSLVTIGVGLFASWKGIPEIWKSIFNKEDVSKISQIKDAFSKLVTYGSSFSAVVRNSQSFGQALSDTVELLGQSDTALGRYITSLVQTATTTAAASGGTATFGVVLQAFAASVGKAALALLKFTWPLLAIGLAIGFIDIITTSFKEASKQLQETSENLENTRKKIESLNSELKTTQERIDELNGKDTLTISEQEELDRLIAQNAELERQIRLEEQREKMLAKQQARDLSDTLDRDNSMRSTTTTVATSEGTYETVEVAAYADQLVAQYEWQKERVAELQNDQIKAQREYNAAMGTEQEKGAKKTLESTEKALEAAEKMLAATENDMTAELSRIQEVYGSAEWQTGDNLERWQKDLNKDLEVVYEQMYKLGIASDETGQMAEDAFNWVTNRDDIKESSDNIAELIDIYNVYTQAIQDVKEKEIDLSDTTYGNIDLNNRQKIVWTEDLIEKYKQALLDWNQPIDEMLGMTSTVIGSADTYDGIDIAFSPMLQTENGAVLLTRDAVNKYIYALLDKAKEGDGQFTTEELFALDASGIEVDGQLIKGLIADIGEEAIATSEAMHYIGESGEIDLLYDALESAAVAAGTTADQIISAFENNNFEELPIFDKIVDELIEVGYISDRTPESIQKVIDAFTTQAEAAGEAAGANDKLTKSLSGVIGKLSSFEEGMGSLSDVYNEFIENGSASAKSLGDLQETFGVGEMTEEYENFVRVLGDSNSTIDEVKSAVESLATAFLNSIDVEELLNPEDMQVAISSLEKLGVIGAQELVQARLDAYTQMMEHQVEMYRLDLSNYATIEEAKVALLNQIIAEKSSVEAGLLQELVESYGDDYSAFATAEKDKLEELKNTTRERARLRAYEMTLTARQAAADRLLASAKTDQDKLNAEKLISRMMKSDSLTADAQQYIFDIERSLAAISPMDTGVQGLLDKYYGQLNIDFSKFKNIGDSGSSKEDALSELDWIDHYFEAIDNRIEANEAKLEDTLANVANITKRNDIINAIIADYKKKMPLIEEVIDEYSLRAQHLYNSFSPDVQQKINNGSLKISEYSDELANQIQEYFDYIGQKSDWEIELANLNVTVDDYELQKFNNVVEAYENERNLEADFTNRVQAQIDLLEEQGERVSEDLYRAMIRGTNNQLDTLREERTRLQNQLNAAMANGIEKGSPQWYEMVTAINDVDAAIIDAETSIESFNNAIQDLHWEAFDKLIDRISFIADEAENLRDLLDTEKVLKNNFAEGYLDGLTELDEKLKDGKISVDEYTKEYDKLAKTFKDAYGWTADGTTALALLTQEMENAKYRSNLYAKEIEDLTANYKSLGYSEDEYQDKLQELKEGQWDAIDAYESAKDAVMDLNEARVEEIKDGIQKQIDAYEELIEKQKESLQQQREQHELAKEDEEYEDQVAAIQRKIRAMENDTSASSVAQQKLLRAELAELEEERRETEYERDMDAKEQALDDSLDLYTEGKEALMDAWDDYLTHEEQVMADSYANITSNVDDINRTIRDLSEQYGIQISDAVTQPWEDAQLTLDDYSSKFESATSTYITKLGTIKSSLESLEDQANKTASAFLAMLEAQAMEVPSVNVGSGGGSGKDPTAGIGTPSWGPGDPDYDSWAGTGVKPSQNSSASISKGQSVTVSTSATNFSSKSGNASMASFVKGGTYTVMQTSGNQVLIGKGGVATGWVDKKDLSKYAKGTLGTKKNELAWVDENGLEEIVMHAQNGRLAYLTKGSSVIPHDISENLMELGRVDPKTWLDNNRPTSVPASFVTQNNKIDMQFGSMINIEHADKDSIPEIKAAVQKQLDSYMKNINNGIKRYSR